MKKKAKETEEKDENTNNNNNNTNQTPTLLNKKRPADNDFQHPSDKEMEEYLIKPSITLSELGGFDEIKKDIHETIGNPLNFYEIYKYLNIEPVKGILLCGPPGCGKTTLAHAIGGEYNIPFYRIAAPQIVSSLSGESEMKIRKLFNKVVESAPSILFIDEIESILGKRENASKDMERRIVAQIMSCIDEISYKDKCGNDPDDRVDSDKGLRSPVFIIGATSKPEFIDSSVRRSGRFDKEIHIGFPNLEMREKMLKSMTADKRLAVDVDFNKMAKMTPGYLAADLQSLIREGGKLAIKRIIGMVENEEKQEKEGMCDSNSKNGDLSENVNMTNNETNNQINNKNTKENDISLLNTNTSTTPTNFENFFIEMSDFEEAVKTIIPTSKREGFSTIPNVSWSDIGGLEKLREELYFDIVMPILEPGKLIKIGIERAVGVLLYGPPGCGKTLLAKAIANEARSNFISVKGPELLNKYVGESEKAVRQLFIRARNSSPCIIFFDELDALCPKRSMDNNAATERVVNQLLTEMDGLEDRKQIFIIAATNRPDIIDPAMLRPGRLDKLHYVSLPEASDRFSILKAVTRNLPFEKDIDFKKIAEKLEGFSGADLASLVRESQLHCVKRVVRASVGKDKENDNDDGDYKVMIKDVKFAMDNITASVSKADRNKYENVSLVFICNIILFDL